MPTPSKRIHPARRIFFVARFIHVYLLGLTFTAAGMIIGVVRTNDRYAIGLALFLYTLGVMVMAIGLWFAGAEVRGHVDNLKWEVKRLTEQKQGLERLLRLSTGREPDDQPAVAPSEYSPRSSHTSQATQQPQVQPTRDVETSSEGDMELVNLFRPSAGRSNPDPYMTQAPPPAFTRTPPPAPPHETEPSAIRSITLRDHLLAPVHTSSTSVYSMTHSISGSMWDHPFADPARVAYPARAYTLSIPDPPSNTPTTATPEVPPPKEHKYWRRFYLPGGGSALEYMKDAEDLAAEAAAEAAAGEVEP